MGIIDSKIISKMDVAGIGYAVVKVDEDFYFDCSIPLIDKSFRMPVDSELVEEIERSVWDYPSYITETHEVEVDDGKGGTIRANLPTGKIIPDGEPVERKAKYWRIKCDGDCISAINAYITEHPEVIK